MNKLLAVLFALLTVFSLLFVRYPQGYEPRTGVKQGYEAFLHREEIEAASYNGTADGAPWSESDPYRLEDTVVLTKEKDRDFVILNFTDLHFGDYDYRAWNAFLVEATVRRLVRRVQPDLITLTGDVQCTGSTVYSVNRIVDLMESLQVPWAPVFGNHDDEGNCDLDYLAETMMSAPHCLMKKGDPEMGVGNYIVNIAEPQADGGAEIVESLILMDSHHTQPNEKQIAWFSWAAAGVDRLSGGKAEVSVLMHIPLPEYQYAYDLAWNEDENRWNDGFGAFGARHETVCCERDESGAPVQRGFFAAIKNSGNTKHVFCGHDHMNNFSLMYEGVRLTYCMKVGYASGFQPGYDGATEIHVGGGGVSRIVQDTVSFGPVIRLADIDTTK